MLQYCSFDVYGPMNYIATIMWCLTMGGTALLFFLSWIGFFWQRMKMQLVLPGIEESAETFGHQMCLAALEWFWFGCLSLTYMTTSWFIHASYCFLKG